MNTIIEIVMEFFLIVVAILCVWVVVEIVLAAFIVLRGLYYDFKFRRENKKYYGKD